MVANPNLVLFALSTVGWRRLWSSSHFIHYVCTNFSQLSLSLALVLEPAQLQRVHSEARQVIKPRLLPFHTFSFHKFFPSYSL
jgi:hypothetical protein